MTHRLRRELGLAVPRGAHTFLSVAKEKCAKESQRHGDSRGGPRRYAPWASVCGSPSGCPRARGVRCRIAPYRSLCSPPTLPTGRFGLRPRPHWGHASLRDSSLRSPFREKALDCPFCRRGSLCRAQHDWPDFTCNPARSELAFFRRQNGRAFFPPLPIAARLRRRLGGGEGQIARVGMIRRGAVDLARQTAKGDPNHVGL